MKNKAFTLVELIAALVVLGIVFGIVGYSVSYITSKGKMGVYKNYEQSLEGSAEIYLLQNMDKDNLLPNVGGQTTITYQMLLNGQVIDQITDPNGGNCDSSYVLITRGPDVSNNFDLNYRVCLICTNYTSDACYK